ncbi:hypothetical protein EYF80_021031 [Liparis tanakae]|uniref:Uncharacterized protein n=1 Tax=Liparis tanakae TaxID=230148 RepID=A0A4Z2HSA0_9TELE|nr:hypothetical protein EYF80_021031 [Liparis tanakae]
MAGWFFLVYSGRKLSFMMRKQTSSRSKKQANSEEFNPGYLSVRHQCGPAHRDSRGKDIFSVAVQCKDRTTPSGQCSRAEDWTLGNLDSIKSYVTAVLIRPAVVPLFHTSNWVSAGKVETHHLLPPEEEEEEERPYVSMFLAILTNWGPVDKTKQIKCG